MAGLPGVAKRVYPSSIVEGRDTLKLGLIKRIGNGLATQIWDTN